MNQGVNNRTAGNPTTLQGYRGGEINAKTGVRSLLDAPARIRLKCCLGGDAECRLIWLG